MAKAKMNKETEISSTSKGVKDTPVDKQEDTYSLFRETVVKLRQQQDYIKTLDQTYEQNEKHLSHMETLLKQNSEQSKKMLEETQRLLKEKDAYELESKYWRSRASNSEITCAMESRLDEDLAQEKRKLERERCLLIQSELDRKIDRKYIRKFDELWKQEQTLRERKNKLTTQLSWYTVQTEALQKIEHVLIDVNRKENDMGSCNRKKEFPKIVNKVEPNCLSQSLTPIKRDPINLPKIKQKDLKLQEADSGKKCSIPKVATYSPQPPIGTPNYSRHVRPTRTLEDINRMPRTCSTPAPQSSFPSHLG
ncbi:hypothetical protein CHS0354_028803 [Potamilus streckersoni]|uniref:Uncharacterized protein n=1 Tax=Potamilus streckersoni TaxID=2493646 RepID=A0AAE0SVL6_9BIVA|nr:hypothetical protein CHS0354_028803 [Potamilus streckersoni]